MISQSHKTGCVWEPGFVKFGHICIHVALAINTKVLHVVNLVLISSHKETPAHTKCN